MGSECIWQYPVLDRQVSSWIFIGISVPDLLVVYLQLAFFIFLWLDQRGNSMDSLALSRWLRLLGVCALEMALCKVCNIWFLWSHEPRGVELGVLLGLRMLGSIIYVIDSIKTDVDAVSFIEPVSVHFVYF